MSSMYLNRFLVCLQVLPQELLKKYITYAKLNVFPRLHDADMDKLTHVYAELQRESSVMSRPYFFLTIISFVAIVCIGFTNMLCSYSLI